MIPRAGPPPPARRSRPAGLARHIVEALLNHRPPTLIRTGQAAGRQDEQRRLPLPRTWQNPALCDGDLAGGRLSRWACDRF